MAERFAGEAQRMLPNLIRRMVRYVAGSEPPARLVRLLTIWLTVISVLDPIKDTLGLDLLGYLQRDWVTVTTFTIGLWAIAEMLWWSRADASLSQASAPISRPDVAGDELDDFLRGLVDTNVDRVMIIANTGRVTVRTVVDEIEKIRDHLSKETISLDILLRSPQSADQHRASQALEIAPYADRLQNFNVKVATRFFAGTLPFRCVIARHKDGEHSAFISFYAWSGTATNSDRRDAAIQPAMIVQKTRQSHTLMDVCLSWFFHLWGSSNIHTIVFDFDDTLFLTTKPQVNGWLLALEQYVSDGIITEADLNAELTPVFHDHDEAYRWMLGTFLDGQSEDIILEKTIPSATTREKIADEFRTLRVAMREGETIKDAAPIPNVLLDELRKLSVSYSLVIVSATSERMIRNVLARWGWDMFPYIIGKDAPKQAWKDLEIKSQNLLRISSLLGIPISRMVFVGDSDADYRSARQLGIPFIENRYNAEYYGRPSLIRELEPLLAGHLVRSSSPGKLTSIIAELSA